MSRYKPYPVYKDSGVEWIGKVPDGWDVKRMRHVASFTNSNVDKKAYDDQEVVRLCNYTDVYYNEFITADLHFMQATASQTEIERFSLRKWDVLITKDSEDPTDIGIPSLVSEDLQGVVCGYHLTVIRASDSPTARLLHRILMSHPTVAHFFVEAPGITRYGLGQDAIGNVPLCLPPPDHRTVVVDWIDRETARIDALIAKKTEFIELLDKKRQALITHAVTKGLDPNVKMKDSGVEWIGEVPEHWDISPFFTVAKEISRSNKGMIESKVLSLSFGRIIQKRESENLGLVPESYETYQIVEPGEIVFRFTDLQNDKNSLRSAQVKERGIITSAYLAIKPFNVNETYLAWLMRAYDHCKVFYTLGGGLRQSLKYSDVKRLPVVIPPLVEQLRSVDFIDRETARIDALIAKIQSSIDLLKERRSALISAAVTGRIDLRNYAAAMEAT